MPMNNEDKLWLDGKITERPGALFQTHYADDFLMIPGAHDPMAALLARSAGFKALYLSGAALTASLGFSGLGAGALSVMGGCSAFVEPASSGVPASVPASFTSTSANVVATRSRSMVRV